MQIFRTNITKLALLLLPPRLRQPALVAFLKAIIAPVEQLKSGFDNLRDAAAYNIAITPQVCYLEKALNDRFDPIIRKISIKNTDKLTPIFIHTNEANMPVLLQLNEPVVIHDNSAYATAGIDFYVYVPARLQLDDKKLYEVKALVNTYKLADKQFKIFTV